ncbi:MAG: M50 family metallopeptidase [Polyangiales bacterium]
MSILDILWAILGISLLVIVHEGGHYLAARAFGMRVLRYSIGFGPTLLRYQPKDSPTTFQICAIPFLAYVQIAGMNPHEKVEADDPGLFQNKSVIARITTIFAGPFANYLTASLIVFALALSGGPHMVPTEPMQVAEVAAGSPAARAGVQVGDIIRRAHGRAVRNVEELAQVTAPRAGKATVYHIERRGQRLPPLTMTPAKHDDGRGIIGVTAKTRRMYLGEAAQAAVVLPYSLTVAQLNGLGELFRRRSTEGLTGPVGMGKLVAEQAHKGWTEYLSMLMLLSVALGMFNLLPFPALDGGRLVFLGYELVTRQRANERFEAAVHFVGLLFLLGVLVLVTFRDVMG